MIVIILVVILGLKLKKKLFWKYGILACIYQNLMAFLFNASGTLQNPEKDGPLTRIIREATADGPGMGIAAIFILILTWGGTIYLLRKGYKMAKEQTKILPIN